METLVSPGEFAAMLGVAEMTVREAIRVGRLVAYDRDGSPVPASAKGRVKFLKPDEAKRQWKEGRSSDRADEEGSPTLIEARRRKLDVETRSRELVLQVRRGALVERASVSLAFQTAGRNIAREMESWEFFAEEAHAVAITGGVPALTAWFRAKAREMCNNLADFFEACPIKDDE